MNPWLVSLLPVLGVVIGAVLQFWSSRASEREKRVESLKNQAYADYLQAVSLSVHLTSDEDYMSARRGLLDAKARILLYGDRHVIEALAEFEKSGSHVQGQGTELFLQVIAAMRGKADPVSEPAIRAVLLGDAGRHKPLG